VESIKHALEVIAGVMRDGVTEHPDHECAHRSVDYHLAVRREHLRLLRDGDQREGSCCAGRYAVAHGVNVIGADELIVITKPRRPSLWRAGVNVLPGHVMEVKDQVSCNYEHSNQRRAKLSRAYILQ
jgi:hypothetical protein